MFQEKHSSHAVPVTVGNSYGINRSQGLVDRYEHLSFIQAYGKQCFGHLNDVPYQVNNNINYT